MRPMRFLTVSPHNAASVPAGEPMPEAVRAYQRRAKAKATVTAYRSDALIFDLWCREHGKAGSIPASPATVAAFLVAEAERGVKASTIGRRAAAIRYAHKLAGQPDPTESEDVRSAMQGVRRTIGAAQRQKALATAEVLAAMLSHTPATLIGARDRAILALGFSGAFRRSELVALDVEDLADAPEGLRVTIRKSKTDQEGRGQEIAIPHGRHVKPVAAVKDWIAAAGITSGPLFRHRARGRAPDGPLHRRHRETLRDGGRPQGRRLLRPQPAGRVRDHGGRARCGTDPHHGR